MVLLWNRALAYPRAPLHSGGPLSREFWQLTTPLSIGDFVIRLTMDKYIAESPVEGVKNTSRPIYTNTFSDISDDELVSSCERLDKLADNYQQLGDKSRKRRFAKPVNDIEVTEKGRKTSVLYHFIIYFSLIQILIYKSVAQQTQHICIAIIQC